MTSSGSESQLEIERERVSEYKGRSMARLQKITGDEGKVENWPSTEPWGIPTSRDREMERRLRRRVWEEGQLKQT